MAIEKNNSKVSRFDSAEFSMGSGSRESASSGDDDELRRKSPVDSEDDDEFDDADSGAGSDDYESLELGESGSEFCQVGDQSCLIPFELYDLTDLSDILSLDVWNECLTDEERFSLTQYLPDMDQETFMHTLKELFEGSNFHFGSPVIQLFEMLKGGLCEPRVSLYRQGLNIFKRRQHYHMMRNYQNSMVTNLLQIRGAWQNCKGYSIDEKLRVLNITRSQRSLMGEKMEHMPTDSSDHDHSMERPWDVRQPKGQSVGHDPSYRASPSSDFIPRGRPVPVEQPQHKKPNPKGVLKLVGSKAGLRKEIVANDLHPRPKSQLKSTPYGSASPLSRLGKASDYDSRDTPRRMKHQMPFQDVDYDYEEGAYRLGPYDRDLNDPLSSFLDQSGSTRPGKRRQVVKGDNYAGDSYMDIPLLPQNGYSSYGQNMNVNQLSDIRVLTAKPSRSRHLHELGKKGKRHVESTSDDQIMPFRGMSKGNHHEFFEQTEPCGNINARPEMGFADTAFQYDNWDSRGMKGKMWKNFPDHKSRSSRSPQQFMSAIPHQSEKRARPLHGKIKKASVATSLKSSRNYGRGEETESGSSDEPDKEEEHNPLMMSKVAFPGPLLENSQSYVTNSGIDRRKEKLPKKSCKESCQTLNVMPPTSRITVDSNGHLQSLNAENYTLDDRYGDDLQVREPLQGSASGVPEGSNHNTSGRSNAKSKKKSKKTGKKVPVPGFVGGNPSKTPPSDRKQRESAGPDAFYDQSQQSSFFEENDYLLADGRCRVDDQIKKAQADDHDSMLVGCSSVTKKRKAETPVDSVDELERSDFANLTLQQQDVSIYPTRRARKKVDADNGVPDLEMLPPVVEATVADEQPEKKPQKKPFSLIKPTVHTDFSFSVVLLLSAVRLAMITPKLDSSEQQNGEHPTVNNGSVENLDVNKTACQEQPVNGSLLTVQEIVDRVRSNPVDPCILETQEPLQDLVRGVLRTFSSRTAPLGAKGWKPLLCYEKSAKSWSWIGPIPQTSLVQENSQEIASPDFWGIPHKMLVKLVDSFANWLKSGQETLRKLGSLPPPPAELMQNVDEKERFRDLRAQKSLTTISPNTDEVRAYFRQEEELRYSVPDRAFSYTAADGKKSIVAPLRRGGGKPTSKARDHFMLKRDRPPHVTILCLVRDAAARLPGSIGTRADVCTLIRDSQYIVEDVTDAQVNQVVSGALDRLHYERDPCVLFDGERKLWVYLHREREEEDFEDDGTSSTKKWRRQKKDPNEQGDQEPATVVYPGSGEQAGSDHGSDLNAYPCNENDKGADVTYDDSSRRTLEGNAENCLVPEQDSSIHHSQPMIWENLGLDHMQDDDKLMCQENATNDFDEHTLNEERLGY